MKLPREIEELLNLARDAALEAGALLKNGYNHPHCIDYKGTVDLVTEMDRASEKLIIDKIKNRYPHHRFHAEESAGGEIPQAEYLWFIDPLDGTTNYAHNLPIFSVTLALRYQGEIVLGAINPPLLGEFYWAVKGRGAFRNEEAIKVSLETRLEHALLGTGIPYDIRENPERILDNFGRFSLASQGVRRPGTASIDLAYLACGRYDGFWEEGLKPWDVASGILLIEEAGGKISGFNGEPYQMGQRDFLASNGFLHGEMLNSIKC